MSTHTGPRPLTSVAQACPRVSRGLAGRGRSRQGGPGVLGAETGPQGLSLLPASRLGAAPHACLHLCVRPRTHVFTRLRPRCLCNTG